MTSSPSTFAVVLRFETGWRRLPGAAFGLRGPTLLGRARVQFPDTADLIALDEAMARHVPEPPPAWRDDAPAACLLVERALFWACAVQRQHKLAVFESGRVLAHRQVDDAWLVDVALPCTEPTASEAAADWAALAVSQALQPQPGVLPGGEAFEALQTLLQRHAVAGVNMFRFLAAAHACGIPARPLVSGVYAFGTGCHTRWLESSYTDRTSVVGSRIAHDKSRAAQVLRQSGLPVAPHLRVASPAQAVDAARHLGYPVVVKPADRGQGLGVAADLRDDAAVSAAFHAAAGHSRHILVEKHFEGQDYRLVVLHGRLIKTVLRQPGGVTGDGRHSVAALVDQALQQTAMARRTQDRGRALLGLDAEALGLLGEQALAPDSIPEPGRFVRLRRRANVSASGTPALVTGPIHTDNRRLAERAAEALQLDLAGVDLIIPDIAVSWMDSGAIICEVNGQPQIGSSTSPGIYEAILEELLPGRRRIPTLLVLGDPGSAADAVRRRALAQGLALGLSGADGVWQGLERLSPPGPSAFASAQVLLAQRGIDAAVVAMPPAQALLFGLPSEHWDAALLVPPASGAAWSDTEMSALWRQIGTALQGPLIATGAAAAPAPPPGWRLPADWCWQADTLPCADAILRQLALARAR